MSSTFPDLPSLPAYLAEETFDAILTRMLAPLKAAGFDVSPGSMAYDVLSPAALELSQLKAEQREALKRPFAMYSFGAYLDHLGEQQAGIVRRTAVKAQTVLRFSGSAGTPVPSGTRVSVSVSQGSTTTAVVFATTTQATVPAGGTVDVLAECETAGTAGNLGAGTLTVLLTPLNGLTTVTNPTAVGDGADDVLGAETESDISLLTRYLQAVQNPPGSGSATDYIRWALSVSGVGDAYAEPRAYGPNTVRLVLAGSNRAPASTAVLEAVEDALYAPYRVLREAEAMTAGGFGVTTDTTRSDDSASSMKMVYSASGQGTLTDRLDLLPLPAPGIWRSLVRVVVNSTAATANLLQVGVYNLTASAWAPTSRNGATQALVTKRATDLSTTLIEVEVEFYWNGLDQIELRIYRLTDDTTTTVWVDRVRLLSTVQREDVTPLAPCTDRFYIETTGVVTANVSYHPTYRAGYDHTAVDAAVQENIKAYLQGLPLGSADTVWYMRIGAAILATEGIAGCSSFLVNEGTADLPKLAGQLAVLGTVTLT